MEGTYVGAWALAIAAGVERGEEGPCRKHLLRMSTSFVAPSFGVFIAEIQIYQQLDF